jgi:hypothetical protein
MMLVTEVLWLPGTGVDLVDRDMSNWTLSRNSKRICMTIRTGQGETGKELVERFSSAGKDARNWAWHANK